MDFGVRMVMVALLAGFLTIALNSIYADKFDTLTGAANMQLLACNDHIDNDGDGYCDYSYGRAHCDDGSIVGDTDCASAGDASECGGAELCDGLDNDCDGIIDEEACSSAFFCDSDGDGVIGMNIDGVCDSFDCVPDGCSIISGRDCNDVNLAISPFAVEECDADGIDNDCDGSIDECSRRCNNLMKDGDESDVDCGGSCGACNLGAVCARNSDCQGYCNNGRCDVSAILPALCSQVSYYPLTHSITVVPSGFEGNLQLFRNEVVRLSALWGDVSVNALMREEDLGCYTGCDGKGSLCCDVKEAMTLASRCGSDTIVVLHNTFDDASRLYDGVFTLTRLYTEQLPVCVLRGEC